MKKAVLLLLIPVLFLFGGCSSGQSSAAKGVENSINQLITEDSISAKWRAYSILASYENLSEEEKAAVSNIDVLYEAIAEADEVKKYAGTWYAEYPLYGLDISLEISEDGYMQWGDTLAEIWVGDGQFYFANEVLGSVCTEDGIRKITVGDICYVQQEYLEEARNKKFYIVEVTPDNVNDIWSEPVLFQENDASNSYVAGSRLYNQGYVYIGSSDDFKVYFKEDTSSSSPFGVIAVFPGEAISITANGTLYFVRESYVQENGMVDSYRTVRLNTGDAFTEINGWYWYPEDYDEYKY